MEDLIRVVRRQRANGGATEAGRGGGRQRDFCFQKDCTC